MVLIYGIMFLISLVLLGLFLALIWKKQKNIWMLVMYCSICVVEIGYALLSLSKTVEFALFANKLVYLGQIFLINSLYSIIYRLCGFKMNKRFSIVQIIVSTLIFGLVCTSGYLPIYYKSATLAYQDGVAMLNKEYGPLHFVYLLYVLIYFSAMMITILLSVKKKLVKSGKTPALFLSIVFGNITMWVVEKFVPINFEFLSISYLSSGLLLLVFYWAMQDYVHVDELSKQASGEEKPTLIFVDNEQRAKRLEEIISSLPEGTSLSARQIDILEGILDGKSRKEIAADLYISENTVKMHTSSLFKTLGVSSRDEIFAMLKK